MKGSAGVRGAIRSLSPVLGAVLTTCLEAAAQQAGDAGLPRSYAGPPAPAPPATIARDTEGRMTIRAVRLTAPLRLDGQLDEAAYSAIEPISDFIQMEPNGGQEATERTDVWLFFDQNNLYVTVRAWESQPNRMIVNEMRRDSNNIRMADCIGFSLDTFYDRRNAFQFEVNPLGARTDGQSTNERQYSADWNPVWDVAVGRFAGGWTVETAIPFKSLRYRPGRAQVWGFNARRNNKWKNEISYLARIPPALGLGRGSFAASLFATVVGIDAPSGAKNLEVKPFATSDLTTDHNATPRISNDLSGDVGADVKYGVTQNLTADFTYNTDFAQVEADEQQVNLTRFSLFFPEKRDFFLENQGTFAFGGAGATGGGAGDTPILFYSRRIGLDAGQSVPILAGGRMTGRAGRFSLGLINIATRQERRAPASHLTTNFAVARIKRDVLRRSSIGALVTTRSVAQNGRGSNQVYGFDGNFAFFENLFVNTYWARTVTDGLAAKDTSYRAHLEYVGDRYGLQVERLEVGDNFNPEVGFLRRDNDMRRNYLQARFSPRPARTTVVRKLSWVGSFAYIDDGGGWLETRTADGEFAIELQNSDRLSVGIVDSYERVKRSFPITTAVRVSPGAYQFTTARAAYLLGQQRAVSGTVQVEAGTFYGGRLASVTFNRARVNLTPRFSLEPSVSLNHVELPQATVTTKLVGSRVTYTVTPLMFASALFQYNSSTNAVSANVRLRWEYHPGSELFIVYTEERDTQTPRFPGLENRALIVKINRLLRF